ncbi:MAG: acetolactate synthase small subunit [Armatimonadota bacterium]
MKHTISTLVEHKPGVLARVAGLFARRGYNIDSLAVGTSERPDCARMTIVVEDEGDRTILEQIGKQLYKLVDVIKVYDHTTDPIVERELALVKVAANPQTRPDIMQVANIFRAGIVDVGEGTVIVEVTGASEKVDALLRLLEPYGLQEVVRTGRVALVRGKKAT